MAKPKPKPAAVRDRIREIRLVPGRDLEPSPLNWRKHPQAQREAMRGVLSEVGVADVLKAWERPDGKLELIDGHLRAEELRDHEWRVAVLDVTEAEARYLIATHDSLGAMAEPDGAILDALMREMNSGDSAVQAMLAALAESAGLYEAPEAPEDFKEVGEDIETEHECPKCGYKWSGGE